MRIPLTTSSTVIPQRIGVWASTLLSTLSIGIVLFTLWTALLLWRAPYDGIAWGGAGPSVGAIDPSGPAARAGVGVGDVLLAVDGVPRDGSLPAYYQRAPGTPMALSLARGGAARTVAYTLSRPPLWERVVRLEPLVVGLVFWIASLIVWALRPYRYVTRLFFLAGQVTTGLLVAGGLGSTGLPWAESIFNLFLLLLGPLVLHFYTYFPGPPIAAAGRILRAAYTAALALALVLFADPPLAAHPAMRIGRGAFVAVTAIAALLVLVRHRAPPAAQIYRRRYALISGMVISLAPLLFGSFLPHIIGGAPLIDYPWTFPFLAVLPLTYAYAVRQGEPGPIEVMLNRGFVYALLALFIVGIYKLIFVVLLLAPDSNWSQPLLGALLALIAALLLTSMRGSVQRWIDRLSYGGWYDYRTLVCTMSAGLSQVHDLEELVKQLTAVLRTMRFETAFLLWPQGDALVLRNNPIPDPSLRAVRLPLDSALARYLQASGRCLSRGQMISQLAPMIASFEPLERTLLADTRLHCWLPLVSRGELRGVLILGERQGEEDLAAEDLDILATLSRQAAVAAENVALIGLLRARLEQVEQMRDEIVEAQNRLAESREAERLHLAQELHDGPIQDLYGARFQIATIEDELRSETSRAHVETALATLQHVTNALRSTCGDLRPPTLAPFGLEVAIRSHATRFRELQPNIELQLDLMHDGQIIPERARLVLFRVCQESLNNIVKHARAGWVLVRLEFDAEQIILEIHDDGCGFHVPQRWIDLARQGHLGLLGIAERVNSIGGTLEVMSSEDAGTVVRVTVGREPEGAAAAAPAYSVPTGTGKGSVGEAPTEKSTHFSNNVGMLYGAARYTRPAPGNRIMEACHDDN